jgi:hypothetical protein
MSLVEEKRRPRWPHHGHMSLVEENKIPYGGYGSYGGYGYYN